MLLASASFYPPPDLGRKECRPRPRRAWKSRLAIRDDRSTISQTCRVTSIESEQQIAAAAAKAAEAARKASDEVTSAWVQSNLKRIQNEQQTNSFLLDMGRQSVDEFIAKARDLENERYSVALAGLRRREAADAGNKVALAKDMADEQILAQDHADK